MSGEEGGENNMRGVGGRGGGRQKRRLPISKLPEPALIVSSDMSCGNHRNQLVETGITNFWGLKWLGSLYRACLLFRSGCHWVKMWLAVEGVVRSQLKADKAAHPPYLAPPCPYNLELVDYLESNYRMFPRAAQKISARDSSGDADEDDQPVWALTEGGRQCRQALWELVAVFPFSMVWRRSTNSDEDRWGS